MKTDKYVTYRIVFVPSGELIKVAVSVANGISNLGEVYFKVDEKSCFSHITIYKAEFPIKNEEKVFEVVRKCSRQVSPFTLKYNNFYTEGGWVGLDFIREKDIYKAHKLLVNTLNSLRKEHIRQKLLDRFKGGDKLSGKQEQYTRKYGYPQVMSEYHPHLSLARFVDTKVADKLVEKYNQKKLSISDSLIKEIAIVQGGDHGTVTRFVKKYQLGDEN